VSKNCSALQWAAENLLQDESFAPEARQKICIFKIAALSGHACLVPFSRFDFLPSRSEVRRSAGNNRTLWYDSGVKLLRTSCSKLGMVYTGDETLLFGSEAVPATDDTQSPHSWPGAPREGTVVEYQLVMSKRDRTA